MHGRGRELHYQRHPPAQRTVGWAAEVQTENGGTPGLAGVRKAPGRTNPGFGSRRISVVEDWFHSPALPAGATVPGVLARQRTGAGGFAIPVVDSCETDRITTPASGALSCFV